MKIAFRQKIFTGFMVMMLLTPCYCLGSENVGTTSANFLKIGVDARALGMAGAVIALPGNVMFGYWNPAVLQFVTKPQIGFMNNRYLQDMQYQFAAFSIPFRNNWTVGLSLAYFSAGEMTKTERIAPGEFNELGRFNAYSYTPILSVAHAFGRYLSFGMNVKPVIETIDRIRGHTVALDLGLLFYRRNFGAAIALRHFGPGYSIEKESFPLPTILSAGVSFSPWKLLTVAAAMEKPVDNEPNVRFGIELTPRRFFHLRSGYNLGPLEDDLGENAGLAFGAGIEYQNLKLDYAFNPLGVLGESHRFSLTYTFSKDQQRQDPARDLTAEQTAISPDIHSEADSFEAPPNEIESIEQLSEEEESQLKKFIIGDILFDSDETLIKSEYKHTLNRVTRFLQQHPESHVLVDGHTDNQAENDYNMKLSQARANSVRNFLVARAGISPDNIEARGFGETQPLVANDTPENRRQNRRVEVIVYYEEHDVNSVEEPIQMHRPANQAAEDLQRVIERVHYAAIKYDFYYRTANPNLKEIALQDARQAEHRARFEANHNGLKLMKVVVNDEKSLYEILSPLESNFNFSGWKRIYSAWNGHLVELSTCYQGQALFILYK